MRTISLNGLDVETLGLVPIEAGPSLAGIARSREFQAWAGRAGGVQSSVSSSPGRTYRWVKMARGLTTYAQRTALLDATSDALAGPLEVRFADGTGRIARGWCTVYEAEVALPPQFGPTRLTTRVVVEVFCPNASRYNEQPEVRVLGTTPVMIPVGTVGHAGYITVTGPNTTPFSIKYRGINGEKEGQLDITPALATGEYLLIDLDQEQLWKYSTSGVATQVFWITSGGLEEWFWVMPRDASRATSAMPTIESSVDAWYVFCLNWEN